MIENLPPCLVDQVDSQVLPDPDGFTKTLGIEWSTTLDCFRLTVSEFPTLKLVTKRSLVSDVAKTFDVFGWFAPSTIIVKILMQRLWEVRIGWDDPVPPDIEESWRKWRNELPMLSTNSLLAATFPRMHLLSLQASMDLVMPPKSLTLVQCTYEW